MYQAERELWCAVIQQACRDLLKSQNDPQAVRNRAKVLDWLSSCPTEDFVTVCDLAGMEHNEVWAFMVVCSDLRGEQRRDMLKQISAPPKIQQPEDCHADGAPQHDSIQRNA